MTTASAGQPAMHRTGILSQRLDGWTLATIAIALLASVPVVSVAVIASGPSGGVWQHLAETVLPLYVRTTLALMTGVGVGTFLVGTGAAWLVTMYRFPGRRLLEWGLLLPLAMPAYVAAYVHTDLLEYAGPVQSWLREVFDWRRPTDYWFPEIRSLSGAIVVMTLVLYPYVYLLARAAFLDQTRGVLEASRTLGRGPLVTFLTVSLPMARPAIVVGVSLAMMETLNDFGTVHFFAVPTFTAGIFDVWVNMGSAPAAAQMACVLLLFVVALVTLERGARRGRRYHQAGRAGAPVPRRILPRGLGWLAGLACLLPVGLGFLLPAAVLVEYATRNYGVALAAQFPAYALNSLTLSGTAALVAVVVGTFMAYGGRLSGSPVLKGAARLASLGYAVPGAILAIGVIVPTAWFDNRVDAAARALFGLPTGLVVSGSMLILVIGFVVRFLALSYGAMEAGLTRITPNMDGAARTLGAGPAGLLRRVHLPLLRSSLTTAGLLVFVDSMKELPMTLILQPFNFGTLATFVHQYAADERFEQSAIGALTIVAVGMLPVIALNRAMDAQRQRPAAARTVP